MFLELTFEGTQHVKSDGGKSTCWSAAMSMWGLFVVAVGGRPSIAWEGLKVRSAVRSAGRRKTPGLPAARCTLFSCDEQVAAN